MVTHFLWNWIKREAEFIEPKLKQATVTTSKFHCSKTRYSFV